MSIMVVLCTDFRACGVVCREEPDASVAAVGCNLLLYELVAPCKSAGG